MSISDELISQFVRATKDDNGYSGETTAYGTIVVYGSTTYVRLDGSDILTPIVSTTEVNNGERVIVRLKNHTATVTGNVDNPSIGRVRVGQLESSIEQTASQIRLEVKDEVEQLEASITVTASTIRSEVSSSIAGLDSRITQTASAIRSEISDEVQGLDSKITQNASSITSLISSQGEFSEFKQTVEGFSFMGAGGTVKISGGDISLTGSITFSDLDKEVKDEIDSAVDTAGNALSTANSASNTANSASTTANSALSTANSASATATSASSTAGQALINANSAVAAAAEAKSIAQSLDIPDYLKSTYIDSTTIMSPIIVGGSFYAVGQTSWTEMTASGLNVYMDGIPIPRIQLLNVDDEVFLFLGAGIGIDNTTGRFLIRKSRYMTRLFYYSSSTGLPCGFTFNDDLTIDVSGTLNA